MQFFKKPNIDFLGKRNTFFLISGTTIIISIILIFIVGLRFGIDFTGGSEIAIKVQKELTTDELRKKLSNAKVFPDEIKSYGEANQFLFRLKEVGEEINKIETAIASTLKDYGVEILKKDSIGPKIGKELRFQAFIAVLLAIIGMLIYIGFRFEFLFGLGATIALVHDVIFTIGMIIIFDRLQIINLEFNQGILAAFLTVVGYSVNDTVIIFDRIRENREKQKGISFIKVANLSINETLSRTTMTVLTVVLVLVIMVFFSGPVLQGFAFTMLVGIIAGTYSSIFIATAFVVFYLEKVKKVKFEEEAKQKPVLSKS